MVLFLLVFFMKSVYSCSCPLKKVGVKKQVKKLWYLTNFVSMNSFSSAGGRDESAFSVRTVASLACALPSTCAMQIGGFLNSASVVIFL